MNRCLIIVILVYLIFGVCLVNAQKLVPAPDFSLVDVSDKLINLSDFMGKNVILVFYVNHAWQPCLQQLGELQKRITEIREVNAEVIAIASLGNRADVEKTQKVLGITFPLVYGPNRKVAEEFGVYDAQRKLAIATMILDKEGMIRFKHTARGDQDRPSFSKIISILKEIK